MESGVAGAIEAVPGTAFSKPVILTPDSSKVETSGSAASRFKHAAQPEDVRLAACPIRSQCRQPRTLRQRARYDIVRGFPQWPCTAPGADRCRRT